MTPTTHPDFESIVLTEAEIQSHIETLASRLNQDYANKTPVLLAVLKGVYPFLSDLTKRLTFYCDIEFIAASSYHGGTATTDWVEIYLWPRMSLKGKDVLIIEDIIDSGLTLKKIKQKVQSEGAASVKLITLLDKPSGRKTKLEADYVGTTVKPLFLVGYGLDFQEKYRNVPFVGVLKKEIITMNAKDYPWRNNQ
jgi:hypoxanthine phosphoribosyltransferase